MRLQEKNFLAYPALLKILVQISNGISNGSQVNKQHRAFLFRVFRLPKSFCTPPNNKRQQETAATAMHNPCVKKAGVRTQISKARRSAFSRENRGWQRRKQNLQRTRHRQTNILQLDRGVSTTALSLRFFPFVCGLHARLLAVFARLVASSVYAFFRPAL